jgi:hypothetical protein
VPRREGQKRRRQQGDEPAEPVAREQVERQEGQRAGGDRDGPQREHHVDQRVLDQPRRQPEHRRHGPQQIHFDPRELERERAEIVEHRLPVEAPGREAPGSEDGAPSAPGRDVLDLEGVDRLVVVQSPGDEIDAIDPNVEAAEQDEGDQGPLQVRGRAARAGAAFERRLAGIGTRLAAPSRQAGDEDEDRQAEQGPPRQKAPLEAAVQRDDVLARQGEHRRERRGEHAKRRVDPRLDRPDSRPRHRHASRLLQLM